MYWNPGQVVAWRQRWRAHEYLSVPVRVVEDNPDLLAVYWSEGTRYEFGPDRWPFADEHPWARPGFWRGHGVLALMKPGAAHAIWHFWRGEDRRFAGWYVNMQEPFQRDGRSYFTQDQELDLVVTRDSTWTWKDEQELLDWVPRGRFTEDEVIAIRAEGERVLSEWPFPTGWEDWAPDPTWPVPELPRT